MADHVKVVLLPANATSRLQPLDAEFQSKVQETPFDILLFHVLTAD